MEKAFQTGSGRLFLFVWELHPEFDHGAAHRHGPVQLDLDHVGILGEHDERVALLHGAPHPDRALEAQEIVGLALRGPGQLGDVGHADPLPAGDHDVDIAVAGVALPGGLFLGDGLVVQAIKIQFYRLVLRSCKCKSNVAKQRSISS